MEEIKFVEKPGVRTNLFELYEVIGNSVNLLPPPLEARNLFDQIINGIQDAQGGGSRFTEFRSPHTVQTGLF